MRSSVSCEHGNGRATTPVTALNKAATARRLGSCIVCLEVCEMRDEVLMYGSIWIFPGWTSVLDRNVDRWIQMVRSVKVGECSSRLLVKPSR